MPVARELTISYGGFNVGGSTARQVTEYVIHEEDYEAGFVEFEFVTTAATEAAFATEVIAVRDAFRDPRNDLTISLGSETLLSRKHSDNTALDTFPSITKDGDPADTGRSRHFRVRIEYGLPADNVGTNFRRYSTVTVEYSPSRQRTVTVSGVYTSNSSDGSTGSFTQYRNQISAYLSTVVSAIDSNATWETIEEPRVERNETDKVTEFTIIAKEILHNQIQGTLNDDDIVDPTMTIEREKIAPGDSTAGGFSFSGVSQELQGGGQGIDPSRQTVFLGTTSSGGGSSESIGRPTMIRINYSCGIDASRTKDLKTKYDSVIRPFLVNEARTCAAGGVVLLRDAPTFDFYANRIEAELEFVSYIAGAKFEQRIMFEDSTMFSRTLIPVTSKDPFEYYEFQAPAVRQARVTIEYKVPTSDSNPNNIVKGLTTSINSIVSGFLTDAEWVPISNKPAAVVFQQGRPDADPALIAEVTIERVAQRRTKKRVSVANAGGVTGATFTT